MMMTTKTPHLVSCLLLLLASPYLASTDRCDQAMTINNFIHLLQKIEDATAEKMTAKDAVNYLNSLTDYDTIPPEHTQAVVPLLKQMIQHEVKADRSGFDDEEAVALGAIISQLSSQPERRPDEPKSEGGSSHDFSALGHRLAYATMKTRVVRSIKDRIGHKGHWSQGCPPKYVIPVRKSAVSRAHIIGDIDGLVLQKELSKNPGVQLSTVLHKYYSGTPGARAAFLCLKEEVDALKAEVIRSCKEMTQTSSLGTNGMPVRFATIKDCQAIGEAALDEMRELLNLEDVCDTDKHAREKASARNSTGKQSEVSLQSVSAKSADCNRLARQGDCSFYQCVEDNYRDCGEEGLALKYALPYCSRFDTFLNDFTALGQEWLQSSRTCLMTGILPHYKTIHLQHGCQAGACSSLMDTFVQLLPECYLEAEPGLCEVLQDGNNWQALMKVFEMDGFGVEHFGLTFQQVEDAMQTCMCHNKNAWSAIKEHMKDKPSFLVQFLQTRNVSADTGVTSECQAYADAGDCRFYECMEDRFPCKNRFYSGHFADFELPSCTEFNKNIDLLASDGKDWLVNSQRCLMQALLPLYNSDSINCAEMHSQMFDLRIDCFVNEGFCGVMEDNDWAFDQSTQTNGFPKYIPTFAPPLTFGSDLQRLSYYYRTLVAFQRLVRDINCECYNRGLQETKYWFTTVYSTKCDCNLRIKN